MKCEHFFAMIEMMRTASTFCSVEKASVTELAM